MCVCVCVCVCAPWQSNALTYTSWSLAFQRKGWEGKEEEEEEEEERRRRRKVYSKLTQEGSASK